MESGRAIWRRTHQLQIVLLVVAIFAVGFVLGSQSSVSNAAQGPAPALGGLDEAFAPLEQAYQLIQTRYIDKVDTPVLVDGAIKGMVDSLGDQYSGYMSPDVYPLFNSDLSGNIEGIGVVIHTIEATGQIEIVNVLKGTPAQTAGVMAGDIFVEVNGQSVEGMNQTDLAALVRGPSGTTVNITFQRGDSTVNYTITRARIEIPNIDSKILDGNIAYISLAEFNNVAAQQIAQAVQDLDVNSRVGLILDLRGNPGGLLRTAIDVGSEFIQDGLILTEDFGDGTQQTYTANGSYLGITVPIVVLVNDSSASASELVSGAMQDHHVATLIGVTTFGKGTVQTIEPLSNGGGVRLTIARWIRPSGQWINGIGVTPDITVEWTPTGPDDTNDLQLNAAVDFIQNGGQTPTPSASQNSSGS